MIKICTKDDIQDCMDIRLEMLKEVNHLPDHYEYDTFFIENSYKHFLSDSQITVFSMVDDKIAGCATLCLLVMMPTFDHPTGKRGHLMNVYTRKEYRHQGIGKEMVQFLIDWAKENGLTEISLDSTEAGRILYKSCGFQDSEECMVLNIRA